MVMLFTSPWGAPLALKTTTKLVDLPATLTAAEGEKRQVTEAGRFPQLNDTIPARFVGVICTVTGAEKEGSTMVTFVGEGVPRESAGAGMFSVKDWFWANEAPPEFPVAVTVRV